jgi:hypothetical protein
LNPVNSKQDENEEENKVKCECLFLVKIQGESGQSNDEEIKMARKRGKIA